MAYSKRILALLGGLLMLGGASPVMAACPPGFPAHLPCPSAPWETVALEHEDRMNRLQRLAGGAVDFTFSVEMISAKDHGLADFPVDIPVLRVVADQDVFFDTASDVIRPEALRTLDIIARSLQLEPPDVSLFIAGHTDSRGDADYNYELGLERAQSVAVALVRRGIYQASVYRISFGEYVALASNDTAAGMARNRRVEFLFSARTEAAVAYLSRQPVSMCDADDQDAQGRCRFGVTLEAVKISVATDAEQTVLALNERAIAVETDPTLTQVQIDQAMQQIEMERVRVPVRIDQVRIPVTISAP